MIRSAIALAAHRSRDLGGDWRTPRNLNEARIGSIREGSPVEKHEIVFQQRTAFVGPAAVQPHVCHFADPGDHCGPCSERAALVDCENMNTTTCPYMDQCPASGDPDLRLSRRVNCDTAIGQSPVVHGDHERLRVCALAFTSGFFTPGLAAFPRMRGCGRRVAAARAPTFCRKEQTARC